MKTTCSIRKMQESDIKDLSRGFISQGWPSREEILTRYFKEQESGEREVLIADLTSAVVGYITILPDAKQGPFAGMAPELSDFNVFEAFQNQGIGNLLIEEAEKRVKLFSDKVTLCRFALRLWSCPEIVHQTRLYSRWFRRLVSKPTFGNECHYSK